MGIKVLEHLPQLTSVDMSGIYSHFCMNRSMKITGDIQALGKCTQLTKVNFYYCEHITGKFEDFKALGALLELSIGGCKKIDCKKALEVLPTMPWAAQIQK